MPEGEWWLAATAALRDHCLWCGWEIIQTPQGSWLDIENRTRCYRDRVHEPKADGEADRADR